MNFWLTVSLQKDKTAHKNGLIPSTIIPCHSKN